MPVQWDFSHNLGIKEMDEQHEIIFGILNKLYKEIESGQPKDEVAKILAQLTDDINTHFVAEENYFDKFNYEEADEHKQEHNKYRQQVEGHCRDWESGSKNITLDQIDFLGNWLLEHIDSLDKKYIKCFHDHGL